MAVVAGQRLHQRGHVFGQAVCIGVAVGVQHLADAGDLGSGLGGGARVVAGDQHMHIATDGFGGGDGVECGALDGGVVVFSNDECGHGLVSSVILWKAGERVAVGAPGIWPGSDGGATMATAVRRSAPQVR